MTGRDFNSLRLRYGWSKPYAGYRPSLIMDCPAIIVPELDEYIIGSLEWSTFDCFKQSVTKDGMFVTSWLDDPYMSGKQHRYVVHPWVAAMIIKFEGKKTNWVIRRAFQILCRLTNSYHQVKYG